MVRYRVNAEARQALLAAYEEARKLNHERIETEHLLLGLLNGGQTTACQALVAMGVSLERLRVSLLLMHPARPAPLTEKPRLSTRSQRVLRLAAAEARGMECAAIGTGHLLIGILRDGEGIASDVLASWSVWVWTAWAHVRKQQDHRGGERQTARATSRG